MNFSPDFSADTEADLADARQRREATASLCEQQLQQLLLQRVELQRQRKCLERQSAELRRQHLWLKRHAVAS